MKLLIVTGTLSLALGALSGWPLALLSQGGTPGGRSWLREPRRLLQLHIDWIMMGILLLAVAVAIPKLPTWVAVLVVIGAVANPLLFVPLAVHGSKARDNVAYRLAAVASFTAMSVGLIATAVVAAV